MATSTQNYLDKSSQILVKTILLLKISNLQKLFDSNTNRFPFIQSLILIR